MCPALGSHGHTALNHCKGATMNPLALVLLIILILLLVGGLPAFGWHNYGYYPSGGLGLVLLIVLLVLLLR